MDNKICMKDFLEMLRKKHLTRESLPLGFGAGLPIILIKNKKLCIMLPYFRFVRGEEADKSLIYPIKYQATYLWPSGKLIEFEDLEYNPVYSKVDFSKPIGTFRHEAIQKYNSGQYEEKRAELYSFYDTLIDFLVNGSEFTAEAEKSFKDLLNVIIEPSLVPIYKVLDEKFARRFLN